MSGDQFILTMSIVTLVGVFAFLGYVYWMFWKKSAEDMAKHSH